MERNQRELVKIRANAKINLSLSVLGKRNDGYHEIDSVMQSINLFDRIYIKKSDNISVKCDGISGDNIVFKAAKNFFDTVNLSGGAEIEIEKNIPESAGLGGGSADAAAVLVGLNKLYGTNLSYEKLLSLAVKIGADVPFLIAGGTARTKGIGEIITPLKKIPDSFFIVAKCGQKPSTAEMFSRLDTADFKKPDIEETVKAINSNDLKLLANSLDNSFSVLWEDDSLKKTLKETNATAVSLSGSGPAYFAIYSDRNTAEKALKTLKEKNVTAFLCEPTEKSIEFE